MKKNSQRHRRFSERRFLGWSLAVALSVASTSFVEAGVYVFFEVSSDKYASLFGQENLEKAEIQMEEAVEDVLRAADASWLLEARGSVDLHVELMDFGGKGLERAAIKFGLETRERGVQLFKKVGGRSNPVFIEGSEDVGVVQTPEKIRELLVTNLRELLESQAFYDLLSVNEIVLASEFGAVTASSKGSNRDVQFLVIPLSAAVFPAAWNLGFEIKVTQGEQQAEPYRLVGSSARSDGRVAAALGQTDAISLSESFQKSFDQRFEGNPVVGVLKGDVDPHHVDRVFDSSAYESKDFDSDRGTRRWVIKEQLDQRERTTGVEVVLRSVKKNPSARSLEQPVKLARGRPQL